jgi:SAM-dependent methyltransferase
LRRAAQGREQSGLKSMNTMAIKEAIAFPLFKLIGYRAPRVSAATFDQQYRTGLWDSLGDLDNLGGLVTVFGYCQYFAPRTILDVGCGAGLLTQKLKVLPYERFLGIDISPVAIAEAQKLVDARTQFAVADAQAFVADAPFDMIVFNQCLYYMSDPLATIRHYGSFLTSGGRMIVSMYDSGRSRAMWSLLRDHIAVEDFMTISQSSGRTTTKVLRPK